MNYYFIYHERIEENVAEMPILGTFGPYAAESAKAALLSFTQEYTLAGDGERLRVKRAGGAT